MCRGLRARLGAVGFFKASEVRDGLITWLGKDLVKGWNDVFLNISSCPLRLKKPIWNDKEVLRMPVVTFFFEELIHNFFFSLRSTFIIQGPLSIPELMAASLEVTIIRGWVGQT